MHQRIHQFYGQEIGATDAPFGHIGRIGYAESNVFENLTKEILFQPLDDKVMQVGTFLHDTPSSAHPILQEPIPRSS